jgi:hypothetical protein
LFEHDIFGKPVSTFPDHAPARPFRVRITLIPEKFDGDASPQKGSPAKRDRANLTRCSAI